MDTKTAFKILNLDATATLEAAKKAYRNLAKKYHPDVVEKNNVPEWKAEAKMKDINLAFRCIAPLLKSKESVKRTKGPKDRPQNIKKNPIKSEKEISDSFLSRVIGFFTRFFYIKTEHEPNKRETKKEQPVMNKKVHFEDIFKRFHAEDLQGEKKTKRTRGKKKSQANNSFNDYLNYMKLKQKIKSGQSGRNRDISIGRVTKIEPITPVNPVGKH